MLLESLRKPTAPAGSQPAFAYPAQRQQTGSAVLQPSDKPQETHSMDMGLIIGCYSFLYSPHCASVPLLALKQREAGSTCRLLQAACLVLESVSRKRLDVWNPHFCQKELQQLSGSYRVSSDFCPISQVLRDSLLQRIDNVSASFLLKVKTHIAQALHTTLHEMFLPPVPSTTNLHNQN